MTRLVTKIRWVVEQTFGKLKMRFKFLGNPAHNSSLVHDFDCVQIAFALMNMFFTPVQSDLIYPEVANMMMARLNQPNVLKPLVEHLNLTQLRVIWRQLEDSSIVTDTDFPQLEWTDLHHISLGSYQLTNSVSYYARHRQSPDGAFFVYIYDPPPKHRVSTIRYADYGIQVQDPLLLKCRVKSRYRAGVDHYEFVLIDKAKTGREAIIAYHCSCKVGARTVGCCSHIMTIIWFLSYGHRFPIHIPNECAPVITLPIGSSDVGSGSEEE